MRIRALQALLLMAACHHDSGPPPATPGDKPPLPPASGTPIGYLIDDASDLKLSDEQVGKLREIDTSLAAELDVIDGRLRQTAKPAESDAAPPQQGMGRHGGGGRRGGMGGMGASGGRGGRHRGQGNPDAPRVASGDANKLTEERAADVRDALHRAFELLDDTQQAAAKKVLDAHDIDVDAGRSTPPPPGEAPEPTEN